MISMISFWMVTDVYLALSFVSPKPNRWFLRMSSLLTIIWSAARKLLRLPEYFKLPSTGSDDGVSLSPCNAMHWHLQKRMASATRAMIWWLRTMFSRICLWIRQSTFLTGISTDSLYSVDAIMAFSWYCVFWCALSFSSILWNLIKGMFTKTPVLFLSFAGTIRAQCMQKAASSDGL